MPSPSSQDVKIYKADTSLRDRVGPLDQAFHPERIAGAEQALIRHLREFEDLAAADMQALAELLPRLKAHPAATVKELNAIAFRLKSNAGTFGYALAGHIAKSLFDYAEHLAAPTPGQTTVLEKHIALLSASFREGQADAHRSQEAILSSLEALIRKYPAS